MSLSIKKIIKSLSFEYIEKYINKGNNNKKVSLKNFVNYLLNKFYLETKIINTDVI
jgi:hypothetical protein